MNWDAIGAIAEVVGAIGVIGTLMYLAVELRKSTVATRQQSYHSIVTRRGEILDSFIQDKELMDIWIKAFSGGELDELDSNRCFYAMLNFMSHFQDIYMQYYAGTIEEKVWEAERRMLGASFGQPGFLSWWTEAEQYFMPEFVEAIAGIEPIKLVIFDQETRTWGRPGGVWQQGVG